MDSNTLDKTLSIIGNIPEPINDECYTPDEYQRAKSIAIESINFLVNLPDKIDSIQSYKMFKGDEPKIEKFEVMYMIDEFIKKLDKLAKY